MLQLLHSICRRDANINRQKNTIPTQSMYFDIKAKIATFQQKKLLGKNVLSLCLSWVISYLLITRPFSASEEAGVVGGALQRRPWCLLMHELHQTSLH